MSTNNKAKKYLTGSQFSIEYMWYDSSMNPVLLYKEEYPDYIPGNSDAVILEEDDYYVKTKVFYPKENKLIIVLETANEKYVRHERLKPYSHKSYSSHYSGDIHKI